MKNVSLSAVTALMMLSTTAEAGPDKTTQNLMDRSVSMFDWGLYRLELLVDDMVEDIFEGADRRTRGFVKYDWDDNVIKVILTSARNPESEESRYTKEEQNQICSELISSIREYAFVDPDTGKIVEDDWDYSGFAAKFSHKGFTYQDEAESLMNLDKKFLIQVHFDRAACSGKLLSTSVSFSK